MSKQTKLKPEDFFTRKTANEGKNMPLDMPDGSPSGEYITVAGVYSDAFLKAESESNYKMLTMLQEEKTRKDNGEDVVLNLEARKAIKLELIASLIVGWSFDVECTPESALQLLAEAPHILEGVDTFAGDRKAFFKKPSVTSSNTQKGSSK